MNLNTLYDELEDQNQHNLAAMVAACAGRDAFVISKLCTIAETHLRKGHLPYELGTQRYELVKGFYPLLPQAGTIAEVAAENDFLGKVLAACRNRDIKAAIGVGKYND